MFPGQGAVYPGMGRELYASEPVFRQAIDDCVDALADTSGFEAASGPGLRECMFCDDAQALLPTAVMQPATFAIEYALARLWMEQYGIRPVAMVGHSVGEFAAATLRSEEHTSELQSLMRISYAVFCLKKKNKTYVKQRSRVLAVHHWIKRI